MGLTTTSSSPPPMAYSMTEIVMPVNGSGSSSGSTVVEKECGRKVDAELKQKIEGYQKGYLCVRDVVGRVEGHEQQRYEVVDYCLDDVACEAGVQGDFVIRFHIPAPFAMTELYHVRREKSIDVNAEFFRAEMDIFSAYVGISKTVP